MKFQGKQCWEYGIIHKYASFPITYNTNSSTSTKSGSSNWWKIRMVAIPLDKINHNKVSKYVNVLTFKEFYPKTKFVSYYLKVFMTGVYMHCLRCSGIFSHGLLNYSIYLVVVLSNGIEHYSRNFKFGLAPSLSPLFSGLTCLYCLYFVLYVRLQTGRIMLWWWPSVR